MEALAEWRIVVFTLLAAFFAVILLTPPGIALAFALARRKFFGRTIVETLVTLPLVLPPVATGLILLRLFSRRSDLGRLLHEIGLDIIFTWRGVVIAMAVMAAPLLIRNARVAFEQVDRRVENIARTLGAGETRIFLTVTLPLAARGIISGIVLAFARSVGEFGATVLVAGNIPGKTTTLSVSIYEAVQSGDDTTAVRFLAVAVVIAFGAVWFSESLNRRSR
jgi:molybdate transport system permease protein